MHTESMRKALKVLSVISLLLAVPPFVIYGLARITASIPSQEEWQKNWWGNHGPLWGGWEDLSITFSLLIMFVLLVITLVTTAVAAFTVKQERLKNFAQGMCLVIAQCSWFYLVGSIVYWSID